MQEALTKGYNSKFGLFQCTWQALKKVQNITRRRKILPNDPTPIQDDEGKVAWSDGAPTQLGKAKIMPTHVKMEKIKEARSKELK